MEPYGYEAYLTSDSQRISVKIIEINELILSLMPKYR
jgi:hypothetical protein